MNGSEDDAVETRTLDRIVPTHTLLEGGGFPVRRPAALGRSVDPFLLIDEMGPVDWPPGQAIGAPAHPHRGFETVTYLLEGRMCHGDNAGHSGEIGPGDVQWMTAGRGVVHEELPHPEFKENGGVMHGFQIWVNLPAKAKMMQPRYQEIPGSEIPNVTSEDGLVLARVIAGECLGAAAKIDTVIPIDYIHFTIQPGGELVQPVKRGMNAMIYCFGGALKIGESDSVETVQDGQLGLLTEGDSVRISVVENATENAEFLLLSGVPIDEPIARYGPFVMNTDAEIQQAFEDYHAGKITGL
jgi:redox-sensitive bicupin YhaK (pirin superfamily)